MSNWFMLNPADLGIIYASPSVRHIVAQEHMSGADILRTSLYDYLAQDDADVIRRDLPLFLRASSLNGCTTRSKLCWERYALLGAC